MSFKGFPVEAFGFYEGLLADNSKAYWQANKHVYEAAVKAPMQALSDAVKDEFGELHLFRPHRDVRFAKDKSPYKTNAGAVTEGEGGEIYYLGLSPDGLMMGAGYYAMALDQLERHRAALDDEVTGSNVAGIVAGLERAGYSIGAIDSLKTAPRGYPKDHPRIELLRRKGLIATCSFQPAAWMSTKGALSRITDVWRGCADLIGWLNGQVGPSNLPPEEFGR